MGVQACAGTLGYLGCSGATEKAAQGLLFQLICFTFRPPKKAQGVSLFACCFVCPPSARFTPVCVVAIDHYFPLGFGVMCHWRRLLLLLFD